MAGTKPTLVFTLIHGTFAKGARWVKKEGKPKLFRCRLRAALEPEYNVQFDDTFDWGHGFFGRPWDNTLSARRSGASKLVEHLKNAVYPPGARRYLVAHSHGGNVALQALKDEAARQKVDGLICLATPFLFSKKAQFRRDLFGFSALVLGLVTWAWGPRLPLGWAIALWTYTSVYWLMFLLILVYTHSDKSNKIDEHLQEFAVPRIPSVWFLRVPEDEVGWLMSFSARVGRGVRWAWQQLNRIGSWFLWGYFLIIYPARFLSEEYNLGWAWIDPATTVFDRIMTPVMLGATPILMAMVILRLSFAFDSVRWVPVLETWSEPVPWEGEKVESISTESRWWRLFGRHTGIHGPATVTIADLVRRGLTEAATRPQTPDPSYAVRTQASSSAST